MDKITGLHIYYYTVCRRKLWYYINECRMEEESELVKIGRLIDESTYMRDEKHIDILGYANIDSVHGNIIRETKKSKSIEEASVWQMKYYLYILKKYGMSDIKGEICYPEINQKIEVLLSQDDICEIEKISDQIYLLAKSPVPSGINKKGICKKCAYFDLCMI